jgi:outer membrane protein assembly factor BamC
VPLAARWRSDVNRFPPGKSRTLAALALALLSAGCTFNSVFSNDRVDYRSNAAKINPLEVPPDLTQLSRDPRYQQQQRGVVSASAMPNAAAPTTLRTAAPATVAPGTLGEYKVERPSRSGRRSSGSGRTWASRW